MHRFVLALVILGLGLGSYLLTGADADDGAKPDGAKPDGAQPEGAKPATPADPEKPADAPKPASADQPTAPKPEVNDKRFHATLLAAAQVYRGYGRVDDEARWAPWMCRRPNLPRVRYSASADPKTHGHKLYYLFAKDRASYVSGGEPKPHPVGQVLVKETWKPVLVEAPESKGDDEKKPGGSPTPRPFGHPDAETVLDEFVSDGAQPSGPAEKPAPKGAHVKSETTVVTVAERDGKRYHASSLAGLFVMFKLDPKTEGTDQGWVYGTLTADGKTVTSAGRVGTCMTCHEQATNDRLFGLPRPR